MSINMSNDDPIPKNIPPDTDAYYEAVASQEEIYLEQTEEQLRAILISEDPSTYVGQENVCVDCCFVAQSLDNELANAAEELITGDSDDPPLSEETVAEMVRLARLYGSDSL